MNKLYLTIIVVFFTVSFSNAQRNFIDEWEAQIGYMNFQGDFGVRGSFRTTLGNSGGVIGAKIYLNFLDNERINCYGCTHLKFNVSINTGYSMLGYGDSYKDAFGIEAAKINALSGQFYFFSTGLNIEYHLSDLKHIDFFSSGIFNRLDPYIGIGGGVTFYNVDIDSEFGNLDKSPEIVPEALKGGIYQGGGIAPMANLEVGIRYRFDETMQFVFSNKWRYYFSDKVDGIEPNKNEVNNLYNDWLFIPSFGVVIFIF
jgi:hypothetical protein